MAKMNFKNALKALAMATGIEDRKLYVACETYVAEIRNWVVHHEDGLPYVYAHVCSTYGALPFIPDEGKLYYHDDLVMWYLDTSDFYFTTKEEATAYATECIFKYVKTIEDASEEE